MSTYLTITATIELPGAHLKSGLDSLPWLIYAATKSTMSQTREKMLARATTGSDTAIMSDFVKAHITITSSPGIPSGDDTVIE